MKSNPCFEKLISSCSKIKYKLTKSKKILVGSHLVIQGDPRPAGGAKDPGTRGE